VILYLQGSVIKIHRHHYLHKAVHIHQHSVWRSTAAKVRTTSSCNSATYQKSVNFVTPLILCELRRKATAITKPSFFSPLKWPSSNT
jgi:hypothetical protein